MHRFLASCLTITFLAAATAHAQAPAAGKGSNVVYLELGGNGLIYSINYEKVMPTKTAIRAGFSYMSVSATGGGGSANASLLAIPLTFSYLAGGAGSMKFEVGAGASFVRFSGSSSVGFGDEVKAGAFVPMATGTLGLRIAPAKGFTFKLGFTPFWHPDAGFVPWGGLSLGMAF